MNETEACLLLVSANSSQGAQQQLQVVHGALHHCMTIRLGLQPFLEVATGVDSSFWVQS